MTKKVEFTIKEMLDAGVHYGHKTNRWNPKMSQFIYGSKGKLHIIDLTKTYAFLKKGVDIVANVAKSNGKILFIGTKNQSASTIEAYAKKCNQYYVNNRWLGGMLTNWTTVKTSIKKFKDIEKELANPESTLTKKEKVKLTRTRDKLERAIGGIKDMGGMPSLIIVFDTNKESIAVKEAAVLGIPTIAIVDTNASLEDVTYIIPGNDDSAKATSFFCNVFAETVLAEQAVKEKVTPRDELKVNVKEKKADDFVAKVAKKEVIEIVVTKEVVAKPVEKEVAKPVKEVAEKPVEKKEEVKKPAAKKPAAKKPVAAAKKPAEKKG